MSTWPALATVRLCYKTTKKFSRIVVNCVGLNANDGFVFIMVLCLDDFVIIFLRDGFHSDNLLNSSFPST